MPAKRVRGEGTSFIPFASAAGLRLLGLARLAMGLGEPSRLKSTSKYQNLVHFSREKGRIQIMQETLYTCRCCGDSIGGLYDGSFFHDHRGPWRRLAYVDGPNAICPECVSQPDSLDALIEDGYEHVSILLYR